MARGLMELNSRRDSSRESAHYHEKIIGEPKNQVNKKIVSEAKDQNLPLNAVQQAAYRKEELLKGAAKTVTAFVTLGTPAFPTAVSSALILGGVDATAKMLGMTETSHWDEALSFAILPGASRDPLPKPNDADYKCVTFDNTASGGTKLDGMVFLAKGLDTQTALKMPCVVIFNQNKALMEDDGKVACAKDYQAKGFNVVLFNYRGVGDSDGHVKCTKDLYDDGGAVVDHLIAGIDIGEGLKLQAQPENIILDGTSIGGAVAIHVGNQHPEATLVASRTFTRWVDAAEGLGKHASNPLVAKLAKKGLKATERADMDNVKNMTARLTHKDHNITIIEDAGKKGDRVLTRDAKLTFDVVQDELQKTTASQKGQLFGQTFVSNTNKENEIVYYDHNTNISLAERTHLSREIISPHEKNIESLKKVAASKNIILDCLAAANKREKDPKKLGIYARLVAGDLDSFIIKHLNEIKELKGDVPYSEEIKGMIHEILQHEEELINLMMSDEKIEVINQILLSLGAKS